MSIDSLGTVGSLAGTPLAKKGPDADKVQRDTIDRSRHIESETRAEIAAGIGQTEEESEASERDADGRRPWEFAPRKNADEPLPDGGIFTPAAKGPTVERGGLIDVSG
jgi:hypothetical protein